MIQNLILISHGGLAQALKESTEMIMGPCDYIHTAALLPEEGPQDFQAKLEELLTSYPDATVLADLMGGTPCNVATRLLMEGRYQYDLYAGMNMPMVLSFINNALLGSDENLTLRAHENIKYINDLVFNTELDDEDE